jgi:hypothetical protein
MRVMWETLIGDQPFQRNGSKHEATLPWWEDLIVVVDR